MEPRTAAGRELLADLEHWGAAKRTDLGAIKRIIAIEAEAADLNDAPRLRVLIREYLRALDGVRSTTDPYEQAGYGAGVDYCEKRLRAALTEGSGE